MANTQKFSDRLYQYATELNALRDDVLDIVSGHKHTGVVDDGSVVNAVDSDTVDSKHANQLQVLAVYDSSVTDYACAATPSAYETDTRATATIVPVVTSTLMVVITGNFASDTARQASMRAQALLDDTTARGIDESFSEAVADMNSNFVVLASYTGVAAGSHTIKLQVRRMTVADTISVLNRAIRVLAIPE